MAQDSNCTFVKALRTVFITTMLLLTGIVAMAEDDTPTGVVVKGNVFGGGNQADVQVNTTVEISTGTVEGNVYGGGNVGDVGTINKTETDEETGKLTYNYKWTNDANPGTTYTWNNTGVCNVTITGGTIGTGVDMSDDGTYANGNVYGAGKGLEDTWWCEKGMTYKTNVTITDGTIRGTVYGGGQVGRVETDAVVTIGTANETGTGSKPNITGNVFGAGAGVKTHGYSALVRGDATVTVQGIALVGKSVYGGGEIASVGKFTVVGGLPKHPDSGGTCTVTIQDNAKIGANGTGHNVFGACKGVTPAYNNTPDDPNRSKSMQLEINAPEDASLWSYCDENDHTFIWRYYKTEADYLDFLETLALTSHPIVTIAEDATVNGSVFGGGERGITLGSVEVNMNGGTVTQDFYGGGALANTNKGNWDDTEYVKVTGLTAEISPVTGLYTRSGDSSENYTYTEITGADAHAAAGTDYYRKGKWVDANYDTSDNSTLYKTIVTLKGGIIGRNVYGGGLGSKDVDDPIEAKVYGDVQVTLNATGTEIPSTEEGGAATYDYCEVKGSIFGCNNENGSPQNAVTVHVYKTVHKNDGTVAAKPDKETNTYELKAVYGGGNLAAYVPANAILDYSVAENKPLVDAAHASVIIEGCDLSSIQTVYGGGNAASSPATNVTINSAYEIEEVFGGGNGKDQITINGVTKDNPGANVGFYDYSAEESTYNTKEKRTTDPDYAPTFISKYVYGSGEASVNIYGGRIHRVFGGSNTKGNVRQTAVTILDNQDPCTLNIEEAYGGGKSAPMDADAKLLMACIPGLTAAYGGAQEADIQGNVVLNITNGTFDQVFGGNNISGTINGSITLNIEETGCVPLIIGELYGGGNEAAYSIYGYTASGTDEKGNTIWNVRESKADGGPEYASPVVNVKSFTSIGNIYGGGLGTTAKMVGNPTVNINVGNGDWYNKSESVIGENATTRPTGGYPIPSHASGAIGAINNVFGGGNAAPVVGSTNVNIGIEEYVEVASVIEGRTDVSRYYTRSGESYNAVPILAKEGITYYSRVVEDNVVTYAEVASASITVGETNVANYYTRSGEGTTDSPFVYTLATTLAAANTTYYMPVLGVDIRGNVYGGGNQAEVTGSTNVTIGKETTTTP